MLESASRRAARRPWSGAPTSSGARPSTAIVVLRQSGTTAVASSRRDDATDARRPDEESHDRASHDKATSDEASSDKASYDKASYEDALRAHCAASLAPYKVPKRFTFRAEPLPRTRSGKLLRREL